MLNLGGVEILIIGGICCILFIVVAVLAGGINYRRDAKFRV